jgi:uncharacterized protein YycO
MKTAGVIFGRSMHPFSLLIRLFTWSRWSHCGIIDSTGKNVIEATAKHGVIVTPLPEFKKRYKKYAVVKLPTADGLDPQSLAMQEIGKPYDFLALLSIVIRRDWESPSRWFCSELIAHSTGMFRRDRVSRVTPEDLWRISR